MRVGTSNFGQIAPFLIVLSLGLPIASEAGVFWTEDFENHLTPNWDTSACGGSPQDGCNAVISTAQAYSGTKSLRGDYTTTDCLHPFPTYVTCGTYYDRYFTPSSEVYFRFYYRTTGFIYDSTTTKHLYLANGIYYPDVVLKHEYGAGNFSMEIEGDYDACPNRLDSCLYRENLTTRNTGNDQWYCIEGHVKYNTPGVQDGVLELWVDGTQTMSYTTLYMRGGSTNNGAVGSATNSSQATMSYIRPYVQWGYGQMYYDDLAVGNTRIGCSGNQPSDITPPSTPSGLSVR